PQPSTAPNLADTLTLRVVDWLVPSHKCCGDPSAKLKKVAVGGVHVVPQPGSEQGDGTAKPSDGRDVSAPSPRTLPMIEDILVLSPVGNKQRTWVGLSRPGDVGGPGEGCLPAWVA
ncbi:MAG: hypothetical protein BJ554DRAFT_4512, partial [Olpidium bornovanus]